MHIIFAVQETAFFYGLESWIRGSRREMEQVIDDECEDQKTAERHCPSRDLCLDAGLFCVAIRPGRTIFCDQLDCRDDVQDERGEKKRSNDPQKCPEAVKKSRVFVNLFRRKENLEIPNEVSEYVSDQDDPGQGHHPFLPDRRLVEAEKCVHAAANIRTWHWSRVQSRK